MIWVAWRQQRWQFVSMAAVLVLGGAALLFTQLSMMNYLTENGLTGCTLPDATGCTGHASDFEYYDLLKNYELAFLALPLVLGLFCGAPMFAKELESGTYVLALTQSVSRRRWLFTKLLVGVVPALVVVGVLQLLLAWCLTTAGQLGPLLEGTFKSVNYGSIGVVSLGYTVFTFSLGVLFGLITRRTVTAMAMTLGGFVAVRVALENVRQYIVPAQFAERPLGGEATVGGPWPRASVDLWIEDGLIKADGTRVTDFKGCYGVSDTAACYREAGFTKTYREWLSGSQDYWTLQVIESGILLGLGVALLVVAAYWMRHRVQ